MGEMSMATTCPLPPIDCDALGGNLAPTAGCSAEVDDDSAGLEEAILVVDLAQLVGGTRAHAIALGGSHIRIVELALEPALRRHPALGRRLHAHVHLALPAAGAFLRGPAALLRHLSML